MICSSASQHKIAGWKIIVLRTRYNYFFTILETYLDSVTRLKWFFLGKMRKRQDSKWFGQIFVQSGLIRLPEQHTKTTETA